VDKSAAEPNLPESTKDRLQALVTHLDVNIANLVHDVGPVWNIFNSIKKELPSKIREVLQPAAYIECHEQKFLGAMERLATREAQKYLPIQEN
jgi:hypothetical protein